MKLEKQKFYSPKLTFPLSMKGTVGNLFSLQEGYVFTPEQLNEYTQNVIKQTLETAAEKCKIKSNLGNLSDINVITSDFLKLIASIDKQSITNTFEETFKNFEV